MTTLLKIGTKVQLDGFECDITGTIGGYANYTNDGEPWADDTPQLGYVVHLDQQHRGMIANESGCLIYASSVIACADNVIAQDLISNETED